METSTMSAVLWAHSHAFQVPESCEETDPSPAKDPTVRAPSDPGQEYRK